jgi:hypothetical protein
MKAILHIGLEKTGTKTLQRFLNLNRDRLIRQQRISNSRSTGVENNRELATYAMDDASFTDDHLAELGIHDVEAKRRFKTSLESRFAAEVETLSAKCDVLILSSEHFQSRLKSSAEITRLQELLDRTGLAVVKVLVYLRDPASLMMSLYSTSLRNGSSRPAPMSATDPHWNHICDHRKTVQTWAGVFGTSVVGPRLYATSRFVGGSLISDFCHATGIDLDDLIIPDRRNESLNPAGQIILQQLNQNMAWLRAPERAADLATVLGFIDEHFSGPGARPTDELVISCRDRFSESNEWVREHYFPELRTLFEALPPARSPDGDHSADEEALARLVAQVASRAERPTHTGGR